MIDPLKLCLSLFFLMSYLLSTGQQQTAFSIFSSDTLTVAELKTDLKQLVKEKFEEEYQPAKLTILSDSGPIEYDIKVRSRGNRRKEVCYYPPIKMKLPKEDFQYNKLKWVLTCNSSDYYSQILLREYLCYKMMEELTDLAFRAKLLRVNFIDTGRKNKEFEAYAIVLEDDDQLADRFGGRVYSPKLLQERLIDEDQQAIFNMFQYMIANTDWALVNRHNIEAVTDTATNAIAIVPYDFDYSGFVGTQYAVPHESVPISAVTERYNKGVCVSKTACEKARQVFLAKKETLISMCKNLPYFDKNYGEHAAAFIEDFYDIIDNREKTISIFSENCADPEKD